MLYLKGQPAAFCRFLGFRAWNPAFTEVTPIFNVLVLKGNRQLLFHPLTLSLLSHYRETVFKSDFLFLFRKALERFGNQKTKEVGTPTTVFLLP